MMNPDGLEKAHVKIVQGWKGPELDVDENENDRPTTRTAEDSCGNAFDGIL